MDEDLRDELQRAYERGSTAREILLIVERYRDRGGTRDPAYAAMNAVIASVEDDDWRYEALLDVADGIHGWGRSIFDGAQGRGERSWRVPPAADWAVESVVLAAADPAASRRFFATYFPEVVEPSGMSARLAFGQPKSVAAPDDARSNFWKVSIACDDVGDTRARLARAGVEISAPVQFRKIGYLCHFAEPGGNEVELLQRTFKGRRPSAASPDRLLLVTLRVRDLDTAHRFYVERLGMRWLASMAVDRVQPRSFDLGFYGSRDDSPPDPQPWSVANREWLWQRPSTIIELQGYRGEPPVTLHASASPNGLLRLECRTSDLEALRIRTRHLAVDDRGDSDAVVFTSPDGHRFVCRGR